MSRRPRARSSPVPRASDDRVTAYARDVVDGRIVAGRLVRLACARHLRDLDEGPARGLVFDVDTACEGIEFFALLTHGKGEWGGRPIDLSPSEAFIIGSLLGWVHADTRLRRFRKAYVEVGKKYGKSTLAAGLGLYLAFFDGEPGAEVYAAATKRDQAAIVFGEARRMVLHGRGLRERIEVRARNLHALDTASKFEPLGADYDSLDGLNIHALLVDELHAHKSRALLDTLETAMGSRAHPLTFIITTAGYDRQSVCWTERDYAVKILDGVLDDDAHFAYVATLDTCATCRAAGRTAPDDTCATCDAWDDEAVWVKANPNYPVTPKADDMRKLAKGAREMPSALNAFKRFRLDVWTESVTRWLPAVEWAANGDPPHAVAGRRGILGVDLSATTDLTAAVAVFPADDGTVDVLAHFWMPRDNVPARMRRDRAPYDVWARDGHLTLTEGNVVDYEAVIEWIAAWPSTWNAELAEVAVDPWNARGVTNRLQGAGVTCVEIRQGYATLTAPCKALEAAVAKRQLRHGNHPVLAWCAANVITETDAFGNMRPSKARSTGRIDGITALVTALARVLVQPTAAASAYDDHRLLVV